MCQACPALLHGVEDVGSRLRDKHNIFKEQISDRMFSPHFKFEPMIGMNQM